VALEGGHEICADAFADFVARTLSRVKRALASPTRRRSRTTLPQLPARHDFVGEMGSHAMRREMIIHAAFISLNAD
jgi:hypothetical protein